MLGFVQEDDIPLGEHRWLTVVSRRAGRRRTAAGAGRPPGGGPIQEALVADGIPYTSFAVEDVHAETERLGAGVRSSSRRRHGAGDTAVFDDTCGNLIQIASPPSA